MDPSTKALSLPPSSAQTPSQAAAINTELEELNQLVQLDCLFVVGFAVGGVGAVAEFADLRAALGV
jgi:hypothetical protein